MAVEPWYLPEEYRKVLPPLLGAVGFVAVPLLGDGAVSTQDVVQIAIAAATAAVVYLVPNLAAGPGRVLKLAAALVVGVGGQYLAVQAGGITPAEWAELVVAALVAGGVYVLPNETDTKYIPSRDDESV